MASCVECVHGKITLHSQDDRCSSANNTTALPPYALRHDETMCGSIAAWFEKKGAPDPVYQAALAVKGEASLLPVVDVPLEVKPPA